MPRPWRQSCTPGPASAWAWRAHAQAGHHATWPHGHRSVLKWRPHTRLADLRAGPFAVVDTLRSAGSPAPATEPAAQVGHAVVTVQELLPGTTMDRPDHDGLDRTLALNAFLTGRPTGHFDIPSLRRPSAERPPRILPPRAAARTRSLHCGTRTLGRVRRRRLPRPAGRDDAVHQDFRPGNLPALDDGSVTGLIDWARAARGDRRFGLVTLLFGLHTEVTARLDAVLDAFPENVLRPAWAHMSLRMTDWALPPLPAGRGRPMAGPGRAAGRLPRP